MPIYAYRCDSCGFGKDVLRKMSDAPLTQCPECGKDTFRKQVTAAGFQLKGSGWYVTDFRGGSNGANGNSNGSNGKSSGDGAAAGADSGKSASGSSDSAASGGSGSSSTGSSSAPAAPAASGGTTTGSA